MRKKLSPKEQALKDIKEAGLSFNSHFDRNIRKTNVQYQDTYNYDYSQLKMVEL